MTPSYPYVLTIRFVLNCLNLEFHLQHTKPDYDVRLYGRKLLGHLASGIEFTDGQRSNYISTCSHVDVYSANRKKTDTDPDSDDIQFCDNDSEVEEKARADNKQYLV